MSGVLNNSDLLIQQYKNSPNLVGLLDEINAIIEVELCVPGSEFEGQASVFDADGIFLDRIGEKFGLPRPFLPAEDVTVLGFEGSENFGFDQAPFTNRLGSVGVPIADDFYRQLIIAKAAQRLTDGTVSSMDNVLTAAFGSGHYIDNQDMTMDVVIEGTLTDDEITILLDTKLLTKPSGVRLVNLYNVHDEDSFGFDDNGINFDNAPFVKIISL